MADRVDWNAYVRGSNRPRGRVQTEGVREVARGVSRRKRERVSPLLVILTGGGLGILAYVHGDGWVRESPLLNVIGSATVLLLLGIGWVAGVGWWCITNSHALRLWVEALLLWGFQPWRSALGVLGVFFILGLFVHRSLGRTRSHRGLVGFAFVLLSLCCLLTWMAAFHELRQLIFSNHIVVPERVILKSETR